MGDAIYGLHSSLCGDVHFILDSLTGMQALWGGEEPVLKFYAKTCPRLYELETIAYWLIETNAHSNRLKANINKIAQVAIDLSVRRGKSTLKILKAEKRQFEISQRVARICLRGSGYCFRVPARWTGRFDLGARIRSVRSQQGVSQKHLAKLTGVTPSTISQVEKNLIYPSLPALLRIAESLSMPVGSFFDGCTAWTRSGCFPPAPVSAPPLTRPSRERLRPSGCCRPTAGCAPILSAAHSTGQEAGSSFFRS